MPATLPGATAQLHELSDLSRRALEIYQENLRELLEPGHEGEGLAIHPASGDYALDNTPTRAGRKLRAQHPEGGIVTLRVGLGPNYALAARIDRPEPDDGPQT